MTGSRSLPGYLQVGGVGRAQLRGGAAEGVQRVPAEVSREAQADVGLEDVAAADAPDCLADGRLVLLR